jgi:hypothetical protein
MRATHEGLLPLAADGPRRTALSLPACKGELDVALVLDSLTSTADVNS